MPKSMTGYGRGENVLHDRRFVAEIKSVNHRYSDINIKLPRVLNPFEDKLRKKVAAQAARGKVDVYISFESFSKSDVKISLNEAVADAYVEQLNKAVARYGLKSGDSLSLIMSFPDVIQIDKSTDEAALEQMREGVESALDLALVKFVEMREAEGAALARDMIDKIERIFGLMRQVVARAPQVLEEYRARLKEKLDETLEGVGVDENRILAEAVIFADRCCVDEELTRLSSHLKQFGMILSGDDGAVGRKLDFLVQEINREINTIGSKSNDLEITQLVVELKAEAEKVREQVQNLE